MKRRSFLKKSTATLAGITIVPRHVLGKGYTPPSDTLYVAAFGVGGRGSSVIDQMFTTGKVKFSAFCDVDWNRAARTFEKYPDVPKFKDFRKVYDQKLSGIDAIMVATPDHTHASTALPFMRQGKHAYVEKPLTHNILEARLMTQVAKEKGIITQMGNQGASSDDSRVAKEWVESGAIGKVHTIDCWTNRPVWPQGVPLPPTEKRVPKTLDWDLWLGPAKMRPYSPHYLPFKWRGWWDFGTGALGDMGCHIMETPFTVLELGYPKEAEASCTTVWSDDFVEADYSFSCPPSSKIHLRFDHPHHGDIALNWYDGGIKPDLPDELRDSETIGDSGGGTIMHGSRGSLIFDTYSKNARFLPSDLKEIFKAPPAKYPRVPNAADGHVANFVEGCLNNQKTSSDFSKSGPLTETVLMGNLAVKAYQFMQLKPGKKVGDWAPYEYPGRKKLLWDGDNMKITNYDLANNWIGREYRKGWEIE